MLGFPLPCILWGRRKFSDGQMLSSSARRSCVEPRNSDVCSFFRDGFKRHCQRPLGDPAKLEDRVVAGRHLVFLCYKSLTAKLCSQRKGWCVSYCQWVIARWHQPSTALRSVGIQEAVWDLAQCWYWRNFYPGEFTGEFKFFQRAHLREISKLVQIVCRTRPVFYLELQLGNPSLLLSVDFGRACLLEETQIRIGRNTCKLIKFSVAHFYISVFVTV